MKGTQMIKDNGLDSRDPDYNDYGYSDFESDYEPTFDQLEDFIAENAVSVLKKLDEDAISDLQELWKERNEETIEDEWNSRGEQ